MNNSQQMLEALEQQDLPKADSYFQKAIEEDSDEVLLELAAYLKPIILKKMINIIATITATVICPLT